MVKLLGQRVGWLRAMPLRVRFALLRRALDADRAMSVTSEHAARIPGLLGQCTRQAFYRRTLDRCGRDVHFGYQTLLSKSDASIGDRVYLGRFCTVGRVSIGEAARIADGVHLLSGRHHHGSAKRGVDDGTVGYERITIGAGAWIGANAIVMADVGAGAIVGAGAVVTKPVAAGQSVVGVPAKPIAEFAPPQPRRAA